MASMAGMSMVQALLAGIMRNEGMDEDKATEFHEKMGDPGFSDKFRAKGNELFSKGEYFGAIAQYNKALVYARNDPARSALCYGNRSAVYFKLEYFEHCLHNIDLAEPNFPSEKVQKLHDRRQRCEMMTTRVDRGLKVFEHDFKLSYPANPKLPFFIDALQLKEDSNHNKRLITTQDLKAGDVIAVIDKPWRSSTNNMDANYILGCYTCADTNNGDLIPGKCRALFCSQECIEKHDRENFNHKDFILMEGMSQSTEYLVGLAEKKFLTHMVDVCGSVDELQKFVDDHRDKNYTVFDFDWSECNDETRYKNMLLAMIDNEIKPEKDDNPPAVQLLRLLKTNNKYKKLFDNPNHISFINEMSFLLMLQQIFYQIHVDDSKCLIANYRHPAMNLLNNSCDPNIVIHSNRRAIIFTVIQPVKAGSEIFATVKSWYQKEKDDLSCCNEDEMSCEPCKMKWTSQLVGSIHYDVERNEFKFFGRNNPKKLASQLKHLKVCADFINKNFEGYHTDATKRSLIATKMCELEDTLHNIGNPFPMSNMILALKPSDGVEKRDEWIKTLKFEHVTEEDEMQDETDDSE